MLVIEVPYCDDLIILACPHRTGLKELKRTVVHWQGVLEDIEEGVSDPCDFRFRPLPLRVPGLSRPGTYHPADGGVFLSSRILEETYETMGIFPSPHRDIMALINPCGTRSRKNWSRGFAQVVQVRIIRYSVENMSALIECSSPEFKFRD
jgi:hypothetical protein